MSRARQLHEQAEHHREHQHYIDSFIHYCEAAEAYEQAGDQVGLSELYAAMSILFRHLVARKQQLSGREFWQNQVEDAVNTSVQIAERAWAENQDASGLAMAYFNRAKWREMNQELNQAIADFQQALIWQETHPHLQHNRSAVIWDFRLKLSLAQLAAGEEAALARINMAIEALLSDEGVDAPYNIPVWVSGAYLKLAEHFATINKPLAQYYWNEAALIIKTHPELRIRLDQLKALQAVLHTHDDLPPR